MNRALKSKRCLDRFSGDKIFAPYDHKAGEKISSLRKSNKSKFKNSVPSVKSVNHSCIRGIKIKTSSKNFEDVVLYIREN